MKREDIIRLAEQASCGWTRNGTEPALFGETQLERFAALVAAEVNKNWVLGSEQGKNQRAHRDNGT